MNDYGGTNHWRILVPRIIVLLIFGTLLLCAGILQLLDNEYEDRAADNYLRYVKTYPPRGEVFDRNGEYLIQSKECYDLMAVWRDLPKEGLDTMLLCDITGLSLKRMQRALSETPKLLRDAKFISLYSRFIAQS